MTLKKFSFKVINQENHSRNGLIETHRGSIHTPAFMPVGTQATIKGAFIDDIIKTGSEIILSNHDKLSDIKSLDDILMKNNIDQEDNFKKLYK